MKKNIYFISLSVFLITNCFAQQLHNFKQIQSAVFEGKSIRLFIDYTKCNNLSRERWVGNRYATYTPNAIAITNDDDIISYLLYFTMNDSHYPAKAVYQHAKFLISKNDFLLLTFTSLNAADYTPLGNSVRLNCKIDDSVKVFSG